MKRESSPHCYFGPSGRKQYRSTGTTVTPYRAMDTLRIVENRAFIEPITEMVLPQIKQSHVPDFRELPLDLMGFSRTVTPTPPMYIL